MSELTVTQLVRNFAEYLNRVALLGERFTILRSNKPVAELHPVPQGRRMRDLPAILAKLPRLSDDDIDRFERDLENARQELRQKAPADPWAP